MLEKLYWYAVAIVLTGIFAGVSLTPSLRDPNTTVPMWQSVVFLGLVGGLFSLPCLHIFVKTLAIYEIEKMNVSLSKRVQLPIKTPRDLT